MPQISLSIIAASLFAFITSFDEVVVSFFTSGGDMSTLSRRMFTSLRDEIDPTIAAISTCLIILSVILLSVAHLVGASRTRES